MSDHCSLAGKNQPLVLDKQPNPAPRLWPHLTVTQRRQLAQHLADLIRGYRQPHLKETSHEPS